MKKGGIYTGYVESVDFPNKGNVIVKTEEDGQTDPFSFALLEFLPSSSQCLSVSNK